MSATRPSGEWVRLQAAIEKLERIKAGSIEGPWVWKGDRIADGAFLEGAADETVIWAYGMHTEGFLVVSEADADLIVTLHRTIDAQLAILRRVLRYYTTTDGGVTVKLELDLADAILGES